MKKLTLVAVLVLACVLNIPVSIAGNSINILGVWQISSDVADASGLRSHDPNNPEYEYFIINEQDGDLFRGFGCPLDQDPLYLDRTDLYGVLEGRKLYITANDALASGTVNNQGTEINAIVQVFGYNENTYENESSTSRVVAIKLDATLYPPPLFDDSSIVP